MNEKQEIIFNLANSLVIFDTKTIAEIAFFSFALTYKYLTILSDMGKLQKHKGFWRVGGKSEYGEHARLLTKSLATILKNYPQSIICREKTISEIGLRPDAIVLLIKEGAGRCYIYEEKNNENPDFTAMKRNTWEQWEGAREYLSRLFGYVVPHFDVITSDELQDYLEGL